MTHEKKQDKKERSIDKSKFEFVQKEEKIFDKKFETKPVGYFKDAMIRFAKNKTNVTASIILGIIIILSVFIPILTNKNYSELEETISYLPPRVPLVEELGFMDGTVFMEDQAVNPSTIDPEYGLGLPEGMNWDYVEIDTLENYKTSCTSSSDDECIGGTNQMRLDSDSQYYAVISPDSQTFTRSNDTYIELMVDRFIDEDDGDRSVEVYLFEDGDEVMVGSVDEIGLHQIDVFDDVTADTLTSKIKIAFVSESHQNRVRLKSISVIDDTQTYRAEGYDLAQYQYSGGAGSYHRVNGLRLMASFRYNKYKDVFGVKRFKSFSSIDMNEIFDENADVCTPPPDPANPDGWEPGEKCPITKIYSRSSGVPVPDPDTGEMIMRYSYDLEVDYMLYMGYEEMPYFFFGTSAGGHDMFAKIFLATRTSLILGVMVASINIFIGIIYGAIMGYYGGKTDIVMQRFAEIMGRIPWLVTLSIAIALIGPGVKTLIVILVINGWIGVSSVTRTQFYRYKGREYVLASRTLGAKDSRLIFRHILPNAIGTIITSSVLMIPFVIFSESTISYLGFGIGHGTEFNFLGMDLSGTSLGVLLADGRLTLQNYPYLTIYPAIMISILMISFNMFGNALRDAFNPSLRGTENG